jgi:hypothetical protein
MHYENNLCENVLKAIFGNKDIAIVQEDFTNSNIWSHLWLQPTTSGLIKPAASYVLLDEKK